MPGFLDFKTFAAKDGERASLVAFDRLAHLDTWRDDPVHRLAQRWGREAFHAEYTISVCAELAQRNFEHTESLQVEGEQ